MWAFSFWLSYAVLQDSLQSSCSYKQAETMPAYALISCIWAGYFTLFIPFQYVNLPLSNVPHSDKYFYQPNQNNPENHPIFFDSLLRITPYISYLNSTFPSHKNLHITFIYIPPPSINPYTIYPYSESPYYTLIYQCISHSISVSINLPS